MPYTLKLSGNETNSLLNALQIASEGIDSIRQNVIGQANEQDQAEKAAVEAEHLKLMQAKADAQENAPAAIKRKKARKKKPSKPSRKK